MRDEPPCSKSGMDIDGVSRIRAFLCRRMMIPVVWSELWYHVSSFGYFVLSLW